MVQITDNVFSTAVALIDDILEQRLPYLEDPYKVFDLWAEVKTADIDLHQLMTSTHFEELWGRVRKHKELTSTLLRIDNELHMRLGYTHYTAVVEGIISAVVRHGSQVDSVIDDVLLDDLPDKDFAVLLRQNTWTVPLWLMEMLDLTRLRKAIDELFRTRETEQAT